MICRKNLFDIVDLSKNGSKYSIIYNIIILVIAVLNLCFVSAVLAYGLNNACIILACITALILLIDYILRWIIADFRLKMGKISFLLYPFTPFALFDLMALFPVFGIFGNGLQLLKSLRFLTLIRKFRYRKNLIITKYTRDINEIATIFIKLKKPLIVVGIFVIFFIFFTALIISFVEDPESFNGSFLNALYWSTITCTSIGYGDFTPTTEIGKVVTIVCALFSVIIIALPVSVVTAGITTGYMAKEAKKNNSVKKESSDEKIEENTLNPPDTTEETNYCTKCGTKCSPEDIYCKKCGHKLR